MGGNQSAVDRVVHVVHCAFELQHTTPKRSDFNALVCKQYPGYSVSSIPDGKTFMRVWQKLLWTDTQFVYQFHQSRLEFGETTTALCDAESGLAQNDPILTLDCTMTTPALIGFGICVYHSSTDQCPAENGGWRPSWAFFAHIFEELCRTDQRLSAFCCPSHKRTSHLTLMSFAQSARIYKKYEVIRYFAASRTSGRDEASAAVWGSCRGPGTGCSAVSPNNEI